METPLACFLTTISPRSTANAKPLVNEAYVCSFVVDEVGGGGYDYGGGWGRFTSRVIRGTCIQREYLEGERYIATLVLEACAAALSLVWLMTTTCRQSSNLHSLKYWFFVAAVRSRHCGMQLFRCVRYFFPDEGGKDDSHHGPLAVPQHREPKGYGPTRPLRVSFCVESVWFRRATGCPKNDSDTISVVERDL